MLSRSNCTSEGYVRAQKDPDKWSKGGTTQTANRFLGNDDLWRFATCLTHGDIGPEHVLVSPSGDLVGVLDWEELAVGDPAADFAWLLHERPADGERALGAYGGPPDQTFRTRAAFRYWLMPFHEVAYGLQSDQPAFVRRGLEGIRERFDAVPS